MAELIEYYKGSYITKNQVNVYLELKKANYDVEAVAKKLGVKVNTVYAARKKLEANIERAIRTLEVAQELGIVLDEERLARLMQE